MPENMCRPTPGGKPLAMASASKAKRARISTFCVFILFTPRSLFRNPRICQHTKKTPAQRGLVSEGVLPTALRGGIIIRLYQCEFFVNDALYVDN